MTTREVVRKRQLAAACQLEYTMLVVSTLGLVALGLVMVFSASSARSQLGGGDAYTLLIRQGIWAGIGVVALLLLSRLDFRVLRRVALPFLVLSFVLLLAVPLIGTSVNGARRWLTFGPISVQPSELIKLSLLLWVAAYVTSRKRPPQTIGQLLKPIGIVTVLAAGIVLIQPDLGTAIALLVGVAAIMLVSGTPLRVLAITGTTTIALGVLAIWLEPYRRERVFSFLNPWADPQDTGFQPIQAMLALGSGGWLGNGLGESVKRAYYLPESSTDMIFAIIGHELGFVGCAVVVLLFATFGWAGFSIAIRCQDPFGKRVAAGVTALVLGQAAINLCAVMGLAPLTGIPLPFVSYGGSSLLIKLAAVGILLNIATSHGKSSAHAQVPDRRRRDSRPRPARDRDRRVADRPRRVGDLRRLA